MLNISLDSINHDSCLGIINFEELDLDNSFTVEAFNYITLLCSINLVCLNCQSDVLCFGILLIVAIHDIIGIIVQFIDSPSFKFIVFDILLDVIKYSSWLDSISIDVNTHDIVKCLFNEASLPDQV